MYRLKYKCTIKDCFESYSKRSDLKKHLIYIHNEYEATYTCPEPNCGIRFQTLKALSAHEKQHGEFECHICNQKFTLDKYLKKHLQIHNEDRLKYKCDQCEREFLYKTNLKVHKRSIHENLRFNCVFCDKSLATKQKLNQHLRLMHENEDFSVNLKDNEEKYDRIIIDEEEEEDDDIDMRTINENSNGFLSLTSASPPTDFDAFNDDNLDFLEEIEFQDLRDYFKEI